MTAGLTVGGGDSTSPAPPLPRKWPYWSDEAARAAAVTVGTGTAGRSWPNPAITALEQDFLRLHPARYGVATSSGTAALWSAFFGLGFHPGDEILVPANTFVATVSPLLWFNADLVFCEPEPSSGLLDLDDAARRLSPRTRGIVVTHVWGIPADTGALRKFADEHGLWLVEDCSHAHGGAYAGEPVGIRGDAAAFSLGSAKLVTGGVGGILLTSRTDVRDRAVLLGQPHERTADLVTDSRLRAYAATGAGANLRMHPVAAVLAADHLGRLERTVTATNANVSQLGRELTGSQLYQLPARNGNWTSGCLYGLRIRLGSDRATSSEVVAELRAHGVPAQLPPPRLLHAAPLFCSARDILTQLDRVPRPPDGGYPIADRLQSQLIGIDLRYLREPEPEFVAWCAARMRDVERRLLTGNRS